MIELQLENERVERLRLQQMGEELIQEIADGASERIERFFHPQVASQLLTPRRYQNMDNAGDLAAKFRQWFGHYNAIQIEDSRVELVGERLGVFYRFLLSEQEGWSRIEQQIFCTLQDGRITQLHLLCSGFQPVPLGEPDSAGDLSLASETLPVEGTLPAVDALLVMHSQAADGGASDVNAASTCAVLTPAIKARLRQLATGQTLEVRVDDLTAREDIQSWCRLSGNRLLSMDELPGPELRFFVQKK